MITLEILRRDDAAVHKWMAAVSQAALPFERRWTLAALKRVDPDLHRRLLEQRALFDQALVTGTAADVQLQGAAMARGYRKAVQAMEGAAEPDDAYLLGQDPRTGFRVAIGAQKAAAERVREIEGAATVWITPDEVAAILAGVENFKPIAAIKKLFPGAEIIDIRPGEPAKSDGGVE